MQICRGVESMHQMKPALAHRDLKPHNILLQKADRSLRRFRSFFRPVWVVRVGVSRACEPKEQAKVRKRSTCTSLALHMWSLGWFAVSSSHDRCACWWGPPGSVCASVNFLLSALCLSLASYGLPRGCKGLCVE